MKKTLTSDIDIAGEPTAKAQAAPKAARAGKPVKATRPRAVAAKPRAKAKKAKPGRSGAKPQAKAVARRTSAKRPARPSVKGMLSVREVAQLSGTPLPSVKKAIQQEKLKTKASPAGVLLSPNAVLAMATFRALNVRLAASQRNLLRNKLFRFREFTLPEIELSTALVVRLNEDLLKLHRRAVEYVEARDRYIESRPEVLGGTPVITGTRLDVYTVAARIAGRGSLKDLMDDYRGIPEEAFLAAVEFARTHPQRGRPNKPWRPKAT